MEGSLGGARGLDLVWGAVRLAALAYAGYLLLVFSLQRGIVFPGAGMGTASPDVPPPPGVERLWLEVSFGRVEAWLLDAGAGTPVALFAHGNGERIEDWKVPTERLREAGLSVLLVEYPGYGRSDGRPSRGAIAEVFETAYDHVSESRTPSAPVVAIGRSLGGGAVSDLALRRPVDALILMSTLSSAADVAWRSFLVPRWLVRDRFDVVSTVSTYQGPVLLMHGTRDDVLPFGNATRIAAARPGLEVVPMACGHNDCLAVWPETVEDVLGFLRAEGLLTEGPA
jgi:pimeloyl-ACP methyl ester carboxylesterase